MSDALRPSVPLSMRFAEQQASSEPLEQMLHNQHQNGFS
jgi:hypothetical protein